MRLGGTFDVDNKEKEIIEIENQHLDKGIWSDIEKSAGLNKRKTFLEKSLTTLFGLKNQCVNYQLYNQNPHKQLFFWLIVFLVQYH